MHQHRLQINATRIIYSKRKLHVRTCSKLFWLSCVSWSKILSSYIIHWYQFFSILHLVERSLSMQMLVLVALFACMSFEVTEPCYNNGFISYAVDGNWTDWGDWNLCSVTCAGGTQSRSRTCTNPPPRYGGRECSGESEDVQSCNEDPCPSKEILSYSYYLNRGSIPISSFKIFHKIDLTKFPFVYGNAH